MGAAPLKLFADIHWYELTSPPFFVVVVVVVVVEYWSFSKQFRYTL